MGRGRAPKGEYAGKTEVMSFRLTPDTKAALRRAAATSGRSLSQEAEHRLRRGLDEEEAISKLWGDVKTSAMLRLAAQVVQSLGTMRESLSFGQNATSAAAGLGSNARPLSTVRFVAGALQSFTRRASSVGDAWGWATRASGRFP